MPPIPTPLGEFACGSIFNIYQHYLEAIPTKLHGSTIITSKILISFAYIVYYFHPENILTFYL